MVGVNDPIWSRVASAAPSARQPNARRRFLIRGLALSLVALTTLVAAEAIVRLSGYSDRYVHGPVYQPWTDAEAIPYVHRSGLRNALAHSRTRFDTDAFGLRSLRPRETLQPKPPGEQRIAVLGDSITFGQGVATGDSFCSVLEAELEARAPARAVRVLNFGVSGYSVREMFETLVRRVPESEPELVLFAVILSDFELGRCGRVDRWGYLHNRKLSSYADRDALRYRVLRQLHLSYLVRDLALRLGLLRRPGSGWPAAAPGELPEAFSYVVRAAHAARERGFAFRVVLLPSAQHNGSELRAVRARLDEDGTPYLDFSRLRAEMSLAEYSASRYDPHPGPLVHARIGRGLAEALAPLLPAAGSR